MTIFSFFSRVDRRRRGVRGTVTAAIAAATLVAVGAGSSSALIDTHPAGGVEGASSARIALGDMNCTATLIAPQYLLTAKHCVGRGTESFISIGAGHFGENHQASEVILNPTTDLAIVKLDTPSRAPVAPLSGLNLAPGMRGDAVGWGGVGGNPLFPVQTTTVTVKRRVTNVPSPEPRLVSIETWVDNGRIQRGDSGGPLFVDGAVAGIAAMSNAGQGNSVDGTIGWYVPVAENLDWISRWAHLPAPRVVGGPSPLVDARVYPSYAPPAGTAGAADLVTQVTANIATLPALSS